MPERPRAATARDTLAIDGARVGRSARGVELPDRVAQVLSFVRTR
jgi:hypothetical protein